MPVEESHEYGERTEDLVINCTFHMKLCELYGTFIRFVHPHVSNCYTFRYKLKNKHKQNISTGPNNGLSLILKGSNPMSLIYDKTVNVGNVNGLKVIIHEQESMPFVIDNAIDIQPGQSTNIGPFGSCAKKSIIKDIYNSSFRTSEKLCEEKAKFHEIFQKCKCLSVEFAKHRFNKNHENYCNYARVNDFSKMVETMECEIDMLQNDNLGSDNDCTWLCEETDYQIITSQTTWPRDVVIQNFIETYMLPLPDMSPPTEREGLLVTLWLTESSAYQT